jgi:hypothetical protein
MKRVYFDLDNSAFIAWLKTRPTGTYDVLLGSDTPDEAEDIVFSIVAKAGVDLVHWLVEKIKAGEMQVKIAAKTDIPQGIVLE